MGIVLMFAAGYVLGARAGGETLDEVIDAAAAIRDSDEFRGLVAAVRSHAAHSLRGLASLLDDTDHSPVTATVPSDLVERVRLIAERH